MTDADYQFRRYRSRVSSLQPAPSLARCLNTMSSEMRRLEMVALAPARRQCLYNLDSGAEGAGTHAAKTCLPVIIRGLRLPLF